MDKSKIKIGDVIWVKLYGDNHIQNGIRPCVVIQNNKGNLYSPTIQVVPLTSKTKKSKLPTHVEIPAGVAGLPKKSLAQCEGARPVSKVDILGYIGVMPNVYMKEISVASIISTPIIGYIAIDDLAMIHDSISL